MKQKTKTPNSSTQVNATHAWLAQPIMKSGQRQPFMILCLVLFAVSTLSSCATLFSDSSDELVFTSEPSGATVLLDGRVIGKTPLTIDLDRDTFHHPRIQLRKEGYQTEELRMAKTLAKISILNLSSMTSWAIDALSGNMIEYSPRSYFIELNKKQASLGDPSAKSDERRQLSAATKFALVNHKPLLRDITRGQGPFLEAYLLDLGVPHAQHADRASQLRQKSAELLAIKYPYEFHRATVGLFGI